MSYDLGDTIAAIGTASGGGLRSVIRVSGPQAVDCWRDLFVPTDADIVADSAARVIAENIRRGEAGAPLLHLVDRDAGY